MVLRYSIAAGALPSGARVERADGALAPRQREAFVPIELSVDYGSRTTGKGRKCRSLILLL